jgi:dihydrofolate reductase
MKLDGYNISMIAAMDKNNIIGQDNDMPWHLPDDLKFFKKNTQNKIVIMGRKTFQSIGSKPLPNRRNIVISRNEKFDAKGADLFTSIEQAIVSCDKKSEVMIIGGGQLYTMMLPYASKLYLTHVDANIEGDTAFPAITNSDWQETSSEFHTSDEKHRYSFTFKTYLKK